MTKLVRDFKAIDPEEAVLVDRIDCSGRACPHEHSLEDEPSSKNPKETGCTNSNRQQDFREKSAEANQDCDACNTYRNVD